MNNDHRQPLHGLTTNDYRTQFQRLCRQTFKPSSSAAQTKPKGFKPSKKNRSNREGTEKLFLRNCTFCKQKLAYVQFFLYLCSVIRKRHA